MLAGRGLEGAGKPGLDLRDQLLLDRSLDHALFQRDQLSQPFSDALSIRRISPKLLDGNELGLE